MPARRTTRPSWSGSAASRKVAIRTSYANAEGLSETDLRDLVKSRHAGAEADAWLLHCATREGLTKRKLLPDGKMVFGGRRNLERRRDGLIGPEEWKAMREALAAVCARTIGLARRHGAGLLVLEKGLGKLRSSGRNKALNRLINGWARTVFAAMLARKARLAGLTVIEV